MKLSLWMYDLHPVAGAVRSIGTIAMLGDDAFDDNLGLCPAVEIEKIEG